MTEEKVTCGHGCNDPNCQKCIAAGCTDIVHDAGKLRAAIREWRNTHKFDILAAERIAALPSGQVPQTVIREVKATINLAALVKS